MRNAENTGRNFHCPDK